MAEQKPMPEWIKNLTVPASTKEFLYKRWLNGDIAPKSPPQDWGVITDVIELFKKIKFTNDVVKESITSDPLLTQTLDPKQIAKDLAAAQKALDSGQSGYKYNGKTYTLTKLRDELIPELVDSQSQAGQQGSRQATSEFIANAQYEADVTDEKFALKKFKDKEITEAELKTAQDKTKASRIVLDRVKKGELASVVESPETGKYQVQFVSEIPATAGVSSGEQLAQRAGVGAQVKPKVAAEKTAAVASTTTDATAVTETTGATAVTGTTGVTGATGATGVTGATGRTTVPGKKTVPGKTGVTAPIDNAWETTFRQTFPAKAWLLDLDRTKYPQLFQLLNTAISQEWYKSPEGLSRFTASLDGTDFYKEISTSKQLKTIQSLVGTLGFEGSDFTKFVSDSINFGYDGDILKQKVYSEVFKKDDSGNYVNPTALSRTKKSADYISTQNIAKAFFNTNPADSDIENVLTGKILSTDYERQQREFAKTRYGHLSNLLDQGMTLESIASAYKSTASRLLELNPNAIDMSTGAFEQAVTFGEEGKKRLMTNSEWEKLLRTDPQYGWEKTSNAKDEARSLSANIAQAFGRII